MTAILSRFRVLCVSHDPGLLRTREMVLRSRYEAVAVADIEQLETLPKFHFDVIVLCHTLATEECDRAVSICRTRWPGARILALTVERSSCERFADEFVHSLDGPAMLLNTIDHLVQDSTLS